MNSTDEPAPAAPAWLLEIPLAHRGLHAAGVPENSIAAFEAAAHGGYGVELDVLLSADGVPVVVHDEELTRLTGRPERVAQRTADELAAMRLLDTDEGIPTLAAVLEVMAGLPVMVELKNGRLRAGKLEAAVARVLDEHRGPVCVCGFNPASLRWFRRRRPEVPRVLTSGGLTNATLLAPMRRRLEELRDLDAVAPVAVSYFIGDLPHPATDRWRARGGALVTWTVADADTLAKARELADNVIFEHVTP